MRRECSACAELPVAAVQPISGGNAPGMAPIKVFDVVTRFNGVYTAT